MTFSAEITARHEEGVLERILRVCRHRGFDWESLRARRDLGTVSIELSGSSERALDLLLRQLEKLDEVLSITPRPSLVDRRLPDASKKLAESLSG